MNLLACMAMLAATPAPVEAGGGMTLVIALTIFVLAMFVGLQIITSIPVMLHTPLMSGTNAIHGIVIVGAIVAAGMGGTVGATVGVVALVAATINVVGGFVVTDRMLRMFQAKGREQGTGKREREQKDNKPSV